MKKIKLSRQRFVESHGATCKNARSWSFINKKDKIIIFGAWDIHTQNNESRIFSERWQISAKGNKQPAYTQSKEHIRLIEEEGYTLKTFPMVMSDDNKDEQGIGPSKIGSFTPELTTKKLRSEKKEDKDGIWNEWVALPVDLPVADNAVQYVLAEEVDDSTPHLEGTTKKVLVNVYERNDKARKKCLKHHGYQCAVCAFDFEQIYGHIGKEYIHVHHVIPLSKIRQEYQIDPINDLVPVCPNCHAMIHRRQPALTVEQLKAQLKK